MNSTDEYILSLIAARLCGEELTPEEEKQLEGWLSLKPENRKLYQGYRDLFEKKERLKLWDDIGIPARLPEKILRPRSGRWHKRILALAGCAAAILLILISVGVFRVPLLENEEVEIASLKSADILPGKQKARLELENGEVIALSDSSMAIRSHHDIQVGDGGVLQYAATNVAEKIKAVYHTLVVGRGGEFQILLPDSTKVWLNSGSELKYPNIFSEDIRQVYLKGEAYFEVKHSDRQPFIVTAGGCDVKVLGTEFNISSYSDDGQVATTLVKGKVAYTAGKEKGELTPGQQCVYNGRTVTVKEVDVDRYISWKNGLFVFDHVRMDELAKQLARWYNIEVFFPDEAARNVSFTGAMERYKPVSYFIDMLNETNTVECSLEGNMLVFRKK